MCMQFKTMVTQRCSGSENHGLFHPAKISQGVGQKDHILDHIWSGHDTDLLPFTSFCKKCRTTNTYANRFELSPIKSMLCNDKMAPKVVFYHTYLVVSGNLVFWPYDLTQHKGPNVTNPICWTCKNCYYMECNVPYVSHKWQIAGT